MDLTLDSDGQRRLAEYFDGIGRILKNEKRRAAFAVYAFGLLADGERKSAEPIAARACPDEKQVDAAHQRLLHFLAQSVWSDAEVRCAAAKYAVEAVTQREPIRDWILDDTGFLKQGKHSVGVQRQYTGSAGKVTNCQVATSLTLASATEHVPVDFALYLPKTWTDDPARRAQVHIPDDVTFKTKPELALDLIDRAIENGLPRGMVHGDVAYGNCNAFRDQVRKRQLEYSFGVDPQTKVWLTDSLQRRRGDALSVRDLAIQIANQRRGYRRTTWREGTRKKLSARFAARRVLPFHDDGRAPQEREVVWLLMEWESGEPSPTKYTFVTLPPKIPRKQLVRRVKQRWRTERVYEDMKGELGFDHYEGRSFPGWHHHVSVALCCYAFVLAERVRHFPPSARGQEAYDALALAA